MHAAQNILNPATASPPWIPDGPWPSILMIAAMAGLVTTFVAIIMLPLPVAMLMSCVIYAVLVIAELRNYIISPIDITALIGWLFLTSAILTRQVDDWLYIAGSLFLGVLFLVSSILLLLGRPFTTFYAATGKGLLIKHWIISGIWTLAYLFGAVLGIVLIPDVMFIIAPWLVVMIAAIVTLVFNLVWFGPATHRDKNFTYEGFRFTEISNDEDSLTKSYELAAREFWPTIRSSPGRKVKSITELAERLRRAYIPYADRVIRFVAWKDGEAVGTIYCTLDGSEGLPVETQSGMSLNDLRKLGTVMEVGNFAIATAYRAKPVLFVGLMRCAVEVAMERGISFIANDSFTSLSGIYRKIGFQSLGTEFADPYGTPCMVLGLNLSKSIVYTQTWEKDSFVSRLDPLINAYLAERCYHRLVLSNFLRPRFLRPYDLALEPLTNSITSERT